MIPENRHIIDVRMNKNDLEILIRGSEEIIPEDSFLEKIKGKKSSELKLGLTLHLLTFIWAIPFC